MLLKAFGPSFNQRTNSTFYHFYSRLSIKHSVYLVELKDWSIDVGTLKRVTFDFMYSKLENDVIK